ncbi:MAG: MMPL family transporter [Gemmatimonadales bacterium]|nr:MMPL family transporter [Gemmatimonadales bacterium]NIN51344.1 MMPL family transporter [Gemmatimonadales bacterium]NIP08808.1 MMPL family transporter [Gemmatimonadales bacterium]NIQ99802.1 MMPL family transporter [Gemmatimonadales bacterium]NIS64295.1 MMPL family transporter [Gemmatimonadales bacterium]
MRKFKEFWLTSFAIDHPTSVVVLTVIVIFMGIGSYLRVPKESMPEIVIPDIIVNTIYPGVAPGDIETLITQPLEDELNTIADVETITSSSVEGFSSINVEFEAGMDMNEALQRVREKVDIAKPELPLAAEEPQIFEINLSEFPIMQVNIAGPYNLVRLRDVAEDLQDRLEQIPSVLEVRLAGGLEREVQVDVDLAKLKFYDLTFDDVIDAVRFENVTVPGGSIDVGDLKYLVRVPGEFETTEPIADIVIITRRGRPIYIRDVATVDFGFKERDSFARLDGNSVISLSVVKRSGRNIIETADAVRAVIDEAEPTFPPGTVVKLTSDQSEDIRDMVSSLENNIISGLILVVAVLLFVLGVRTAPFVGLAIPLSMLLSFSVMQLAGFSMNMVVLFSLILALGMLVDNAIVVVENIYRFRERRFDRVRAAKYATAEVAVPIIASTATTLAAFLPMAFWPGIVGEFMKYLPLTLIITLSSSLFVALVILPTLGSRMLDTEDAPVGMTPGMRNVLIAGGAIAVLIMLVSNWLTAVLLLLTGALVYGFHHYLGHPAGHWVMTSGLPRVIRRYEVVLRWALAHRLRMVAGAAAALILAVAVFGFLNAGVEFFPEDIPPRTAYVQVEGPLGTRVEQTDRIVRDIERQLAGLPGREDVESVVATVGSRVSAGFDGGSGTHLGTVAINLLDYQDRQHDAFETLAGIRESVGADIAGADISVEEPDMGPPTGLPINVEITGDDPPTLKRLGDEVVSLLENSPIFSKLDGLESDMAEGRPELVVDVDREKAALHGLNTTDIGTTIRSAINGTEASTYRDGNDEYDITVRLAKPYREDLNSLADLTVTSDDGAQIPLSSVATWRVDKGYGDVNRKDLDRVVTVSSEVRPGYNANAVLAEVQQELEPFAASLPTGYSLRYTGQQEEQQESEAFLTGAFILALFLIAFILISQFDSVTKPLIILSSVVLSTIGVLIALMIFRMPFGIIATGVGVISLAGVVVNNAIVLIDYIDILRTRDRLERLEAIVRGGMTRFRPVMLTAVTTILGLLPLSVGLNFDFQGLYSRLQPELYWGGEQAAFWGPMAIAIIAGLAFATFLTLVLVPVMYSLFDDFDEFAKRYLTRSHEEQATTGKAADRPGRSSATPSGEPVTV